MRSMSLSSVRKTTIAYIVVSQGFFTDAMSIEVEQKFTMTRVGPQILKDLGFVSVCSDKAMTDWYFDDESFSLLRQDCWLRLRALGDSGNKSSNGKWQLKVGNGSGSATTVYTEIEGPEAVADALSNKFDNFDGELLPKLPDDYRKIEVTDSRTSTVADSQCQLVAFARIGTYRSSWKLLDERFGSINIDLDSTDFEYAIGEVEIEVDTHDLVPSARKKIQEVVEAVSGRSNTTEKPMGKLEYYLFHQRPDVYKICVDCGVI